MKPDNTVKSSKLIREFRETFQRRFGFEPEEYYPIGQIKRFLRESAKSRPLTKV